MKLFHSQMSHWRLGPSIWWGLLSLVSLLESLQSRFERDKTRCFQHKLSLEASQNGGKPHFRSSRIHHVAPAVFGQSQEVSLKALAAFVEPQACKCAFNDAASLLEHAEICDR